MVINAPQYANLRARVSIPSMSIPARPTTGSKDSPPRSPSRGHAICCRRNLFAAQAL